MNARRQLLLVLLIPLFGVFFVGLTLGPIEMVVWLVLFAAWVVAFKTWAKRSAKVTSST
jgi:hypothetical protein